MNLLFDQEKVMEMHDYNLAQEKKAEGIAEGKAEEREASIAAVITTMRGTAISREQVAQFLTKAWNLSTQEAEEKVSQYWKS